MTTEIHITNSTLSLLLKPASTIDKAALEVLYSNTSTGKKLTFTRANDDTYILSQDLNGTQHAV